MMYKVKDREELDKIIEKINQGDNSILLQDLDIHASPSKVKKTRVDWDII